MKILITGGGGYIGKSIYSALYDNHDITVVTRRDFDLTCWESTYKFFQNKSFDVVIHAAVAGGHRLKEDNDSVIRENLLMYRNLLNHQDKFTKFISFGSGAELNNPTTPYGISKQAIANHMAIKPNFLNLRIFSVFDENELNTRFIKANILRYLAKEDMEVHSDKFMDFFYMEDLISLVDYYITATNHPTVLDCCYLEKYKLSEVANLINTLDDYKVEVKVNNPTPDTDYVGNYIGLPIKLVGLQEGIKRTYDTLKLNT